MTDSRASVDFSTLSHTALLEALHRINRAEFPDNYNSCLAEIQKRKVKGKWHESDVDSAQAGPLRKGSNPRLVAGFWIRLLADLIDHALIWLIGVLIGLVAESWLLKMGDHGMWLGLVVSLLYFVPAQSRYGRGQTPGKRALGIQVLSLDGNPLTLTKSFFRYLLIALVGYISILTGLAKLVLSQTLYGYVYYILMACWALACLGCYMLVALHPLKRGLQDFLVKSIVVYRNRFDCGKLVALKNANRSKLAFTVVGVISTVVFVFGGRFIAGSTDAMPIASLVEIQTQLQDTGQFSGTSFNYDTYTVNSQPARSIIVQSYVGGPLNQTTQNLKPLYDIAFRTIREHISDLKPQDRLRVGLRFGYNIGIRDRTLTLFQEEDPMSPGVRKDAGVNTSY